MQPQQERQLGELVTDIIELADALEWLDLKPDEAQTLEALQDAADDLWALWREMQVEKDVAT